jgi:predicted amidohydrolase
VSTNEQHGNKQGQRHGSAPVVWAAAQSLSVAGDVAANVRRHLRFMEIAAEQGAGFLLFPELSLTGYEPAMARDLAFTELDSRLQLLNNKAQALKMVTVVGAPLLSRARDDVQIAALTLGLGVGARVYTKQHLHSGEESVFTVGSGGAYVDLEEERVHLAVCADFSHAAHAQKAATAGATLYAASVLISGPGYANDSGLLQDYSRTHRMPVLMANHAGVTGGWQSAGRSALWAETGERVAQIAGVDEGLLIASRTERGWTARTLTVCL